MNDFARVLHRLLVEWPAELLDRLNFRKILFLIGLMLLIWTFAQVLTIDVALIAAGDAMTYFEIFAAVTMIAARGHVRTLLQLSRQKLLAATARVRLSLRSMRSRGMARTLRRHIRHALIPKTSDDEDTAGMFIAKWMGMGMEFA